MPRSPGFSAFIIPTFCLLVFAGCGGSKSIVVKGTVVLPAKTQLVESDDVKISLIPDDPAGKTAVGKAAGKDLSFELKAADGKGIPPGTYKITVKITPYAGEKDSSERAKQFEGVNKTFDAKSTPLSYEVTKDATQTIAIDLGLGKVTKN
jgi:hypothetical protein